MYIVYTNFNYSLIISIYLCMPNKSYIYICAVNLITVGITSIGYN